MGKCEEKVEKSKGRLTRCDSKTYRANSEGQGFTDGNGWQWQAHHIACDHAVAQRSDGLTAEQAEYIDECLRLTKWDINDSDNMIGLPTNFQYRKSGGLEPDDNLCSHQVDHNTDEGYTDECKKWLQSALKKKLLKAKKLHDIEAEAIRKIFEKCTSTFKTHLETRGSRKPGTRIGYTKRFEKKYEDNWYHPFSMAEEPNPRHRGPNPDLDEDLVEKVFKLQG